MSRLAPSSQSHQNESCRNIETIYVLHLEQTPAQGRCWINLLTEWVCIMSAVWQTNWNDIPNDGKSDLLDLGDHLLRAIQKFYDKPWGPKSDSRPMASRARGNQRLPWNSSPRACGSDRGAHGVVQSESVGCQWPCRPQISMSVVKCLQSFLIKVYLTTWEGNQKISSRVYF